MGSLRAPHNFMEILELLPKLTIHQKEAAKTIFNHVGMDIFVKSALFRAMRQGAPTNEILDLINKLGGNATNKMKGRLSQEQIAEAQKLWQKLG